MTSKSTGQAKLEDAIVVAEVMVKSGGKKPTIADTVLSDEEFEQIQHAHFDRKQDPAAQSRAAKTLDDCLEAIAAFKEITGLTEIARATADDCAAFQRKALTLPKNWRKQYPNSKKDVEHLAANTVLKWSRALQAAFERANRNAGKKSVRGVVEENKLLAANPWKQFTWIGGTKRPIRQFDGDELLSFLSFLETKWSGVIVATSVAKVCLWSWGRRAEVMGLQWSSYRHVGGEHHFEIIGKWGVEKWFRVPENLYQELLRLKTESSFVFAAHNTQLRTFHEQHGRVNQARRVTSAFNPVNLGDWFHEQIVAWSKTQPKGHATTHLFRKTSLQYARIGEDVNRQIAADARLSEGVMMTNYVKETDEQMRAKSNRMFARVLASLPAEVAARYGHTEDQHGGLKERIKAAAAAEDWKLVAELTAELNRQEDLPLTG